MELINQTAVVCDLQVSPIEGSDPERRYALLTAKATFVVDEREQPRDLVRPGPVPLALHAAKQFAGRRELRVGLVDGARRLAHLRVRAQGTLARRARHRAGARDTRNGE